MHCRFSPDKNSHCHFRRSAAECAPMGKTREKRQAEQPKRNHHGNRLEELERLRDKRRRAAFASRPPLRADMPAIADIRDALAAARTSLAAALRTGHLVHLLQRTIRWNLFTDFLGEDRLPGVRGHLSGDRLDPETFVPVELDIDLNGRYKTLMRHKRLWERFAEATGLPPDEPPDAALGGTAPAPPGSPAAAARALLARAGGTSAGLLRELGPSRRGAVVRRRKMW